MTHLVRALSAELFKLRGTRALWLALLAPLFVPFIQFASLYTFTGDGAPEYAWAKFISGTSFTWLFGLLILYITLEAALLAAIEHNADTWKYLHALPVSRGAFYLAKVGVALLLITGSSVLFFLTTLLAGALLARVRPDIGFARHAPDIANFAGIVFLSYLASLFVIAIQTWISIRFRNFIVPLAVGILGVVLSEVANRNEAVQYYWPWIQPVELLRKVGIPGADKLLETGPSVAHILVYCIVGSVVITGVALWDISRRDTL